MPSPGDGGLGIHTLLCYFEKIAKCQIADLLIEEYENKNLVNDLNSTDYDVIINVVAKNDIIKKTFNY